MQDVLGRICRSTAAFLALAAISCAQEKIAQYDVSWESPSQDSHGSMPLGNGDIGLNVWTEESGDIVFYISKTDAWSENVRLLKLGRIRLRLNPNPFVKGEPFRQTLRLGRGDVTITGGAQSNTARILIWVDANRPEIRVEAETGQPAEMQVFYERWREQERVIDGPELESLFGLSSSPVALKNYGDSIQLDQPDRIVWFHRNERSAWPAIMKLEGFGEPGDKYADPLINRTFGASLQGQGLKKMNPSALRSTEKRTKHAISIFPFTAQNGSVDEWMSRLGGVIASIESVPVDRRRAAHEKWWQAFWDRSEISVTGGAEQRAVSSGYVLQRYLNACAGRGEYPIVPNGSLFTVDAVTKDEEHLDPDYRRGGSGYSFQTLGLPYWSMLASGDFDLMQPLLTMFRLDRRFEEDRTRLYYGHDGFLFPERMYFWGAYLPDDYGWNRQGKQTSYIENASVRNYQTGNLELLSILLDYYGYTQDKGFMRTTLQPLAEGILTFYAKHYTPSADGKLGLEPSQALSAWPDAVNPTPDIAGLQHVLSELAAHKVSLSRGATQAARMLTANLPQITSAKVDGKTVLRPAEVAAGEPKTAQNPELYPVFPFRLYGVEKPNTEIALATFAGRHAKENTGWALDAIQAADLGLTAEAKKDVVERFSNHDPASRFAGFWPAGTGWTPNQDHGAVAMIALQSMLMQCDGGNIVMFPAWPKDWDVDFRLFAPQNTIVEGSYKAGKLERFVVTPSKRMGDVTRKDPK